MLSSIVCSFVARYVAMLINTPDMGGVKLVRCMCCIYSVLYLLSVIFVLFNVLAWLF